MSTRVNNPFSVNSYLGADYFCDREKELERLDSAIYNGANVTFISPRRMGKTGLIRHFFAQNQGKNTNCLYVDLDGTSCMNDFVRVFSETLLQTSISWPQRMMKNVIRMLSVLRPTMTPNPLTGELSWSVSVEPNQDIPTLQSIFSYLESSGKPCIVAFDEFQTIANYTEKNVEATLRSYIQHMRNVHFIFAGSQRHIMSEMFLSPKHPFYRSTDLLTLDAIPKEKYYEFAARHISSIRQKFAESDFDYLYDKFEGHTWYLQCVLNKLYANRVAPTTENINLMIRQIVTENASSYLAFCQLLPKNQVELLRAVAKSGEVSEISNMEFIQANSLSAPSTVRAAAKSLVNKEFLYLNLGKYTVYDRFFALWLLNCNR